MPISFLETMEGPLVDRDGRAHHAVLDLRCESGRIASFTLDGLARITGTFSAGPWADAAACEGTLEVRPVRGRRLGYTAEFRGTDNARYRLVGVKHPNPLRPLASMTTLHTRLLREGECVAEGILRFEWNTLGAFLASWRPWHGMQTQPMTAPPRHPDLPGPEPLDPLERRTMHALGEALIAPGVKVPPLDDETVEQAIAILAFLPGHLQLVFRAALRALDAGARLRHRQAFAALPLDRRRNLLRDAEGLGTAGAAATLLLGMPIKSAHFARREYLDALGVPDYRNPVREKEPRWLQNHTPAEALGERETVVDADVVIIGTGAGGGPVAASLAEAGLGVVLLEEGHYHRREDFAGDPAERLLRFWRDGGVNSTIGNAPVVLPLGRMVGGSTAINSGTCFRTPDDVLQRWRDEGLPEDFAPENFARWLDLAEAELGVEPGDPAWLGRIAEAVAKGADALGGIHGPLRRNAPGCDGQGLCVVGCPTGAKRSSDVSWVPRALKAGAALFTGLPVTRLLMRGRRCHGVLATGQDRHGAPRTLEVRAKIVVVACGTLHSPVLLARNGIRLPWLGRNLSVHPAVGVHALFPESQGQPWRAIPQSYGVEGLVDPRVRFEGFAGPPQLTAPSMTLFGEELTRWMDRFDHIGQYGFMVCDDGNGRVVPGPDGRPLVHYHVDREATALFRRGSAVLSEMLFTGGASEISTGIDGVGVIRSIDEARAIAARPLRAHHFRLMGFHPLGTCRMGSRPDRGVVDPDHRVWGTTNLHVIDGSTIPTGLGVNPQITIMAAALRAAEGIRDRLGG
ncbi:MAG: GMC oxidoreductase [Deltaproteobacteria bacterium]|nr:MAG: GMC oxidoreductase [Deltaproteobacteria bacterium]